MKVQRKVDAVLLIILRVDMQPTNLSRLKMEDLLEQLSREQLVLYLTKFFDTESGNKAKFEEILKKIEHRVNSNNHLRLYLTEGIVRSIHFKNLTLILQFVSDISLSDFDTN
jgi:hypothetical protein